MLDLFQIEVVLFSAVGAEKDEAAKRRKRMYEKGDRIDNEIDVVMYNKYALENHDGSITSTEPVSNSFRRFFTLFYTFSAKIQ